MSVLTRTSIARRTTDGSTAAAAMELIAGVNGFFLLEMQVILAAATASTYGLGRPAAAGITPTSPVTNLSEDSSVDRLPLVKTAVAWGTGPTVPAAFFKRVGFPNVITSTIVWTFGAKGLFVPGNTTIVLWNLAANGVVDVNVAVNEQI